MEKMKNESVEFLIQFSTHFYSRTFALILLRSMISLKFSENTYIFYSEICDYKANHQNAHIIKACVSMCMCQGWGFFQNTLNSI